MKPLSVGKDQVELFPELLESGQRGRSSAGSEHLPSKQDVAGSSPAVPSTPEKPLLRLRNDHAFEQLKAVAEFAAFAAIPMDEFARICQYRYVVAVLEMESGNQCRAGARSGSHRNTFRRWMAEFNLRSKDFKPKKKKPRAYGAAGRKARRA
jgi:hypothetical protein